MDGHVVNKNKDVIWILNIQNSVTVKPPIVYFVKFASWSIAKAILMDGRSKEGICIVQPVRMLQIIGADNAYVSGAKFGAIVRPSHGDIS